MKKIDLRGKRRKIVKIMISLSNRYKNWLSERDDRKILYKSLIALVVPIAIQNLLGALVNSVDILMLGYVGQDELSAVSLANQYMFLLWGFFFGINSATSLMNSQYWGKGDKRAIQAILGIAIKMSLVITSIVALGCVFCSKSLMTLYTNDETLISIGSVYLKTTGISYVLMSFSQCYQCTLRSVEQAKKSTVISTITVITNVVLNAVFIFGLFGLPKMGVIGVATATIIARVLELIICLSDYIRGSIFKPDLALLFGKHMELTKDFVKYAGPALVNDLSWTIAFSTYSIILGHLNNDMVAASSVATTIRDLFTTVCFGLGSGGTVIIGKELGANKLERARKDASTLCVITFLFTIVMSVVLVAVRHPVMKLFTLSDTAFGYLDLMLLISSYYIIGQAMNTLLIAGIFRAGGNTKFGMICDTITMWGVSVPLGFITAFVLKWPPMVVYFVLCLDEFWKIPAVYKYYKSYKWLNNITRDEIV